MMVHPRGEEIFAGGAGGLHGFGGCVTRPAHGAGPPWKSVANDVARFGCRPELSEVGSDSIRRHRRLGKCRARRVGTQFPLPRRRRRDDHGSGSCERLAQSLIAAKDKRLIILDRSSGKPSELVTLEWRDRGRIKKVAGIERAVAQEFEDSSVQLV